MSLASSIKGIPHHHHSHLIFKYISSSSSSSSSSSRVAKDECAPLPDMARKRDECKWVFHRGKFHDIGGYCTEMRKPLILQTGSGTGKGGFPGSQHLSEDLRGRWWHGDVHVSCGWGGGTTGLQMADSSRDASWDSPHSLHEYMGGEAVSNWMQKLWWSLRGVHVGFEESQVEESGGAGGILGTCSVRLLFGDLNCSQMKDDKFLSMFLLFEGYDGMMYNFLKHLKQGSFNLTEWILDVKWKEFWKIFKGFIHQIRMQCWIRSLFRSSVSAKCQNHRTSEPKFSFLLGKKYAWENVPH